MKNKCLMKYTIKKLRQASILVFTILTIMAFSVGGVDQISTSSESSTVQATQMTDVVPSGVYICNGKYATKFHSKRSCWGLNKCKSTISSTSLSKAQERGFSPCKICYK